MKGVLLTSALLLMMTACTTGNGENEKREHRLAVVNPGHFHAALVTKSPLAGVSDTISVYAPAGTEFESYRALIDSYNSREENPTRWVLKVDSSARFIDNMASGREADIVVLAGDNHDKPDYILAAARSGKNILADKPMAIDREGYCKLAEAFETAGRDSLVIYELMTERYDTLNIVTREIVNDPERFGSFVANNDGVAISMKSVHHFYKEVSGKPLQRPAWYYDVTHQGEGIADVTTHLIDLIMWQAFPDQAILPADIVITDAGHSSTVLSPEQFMRSTGVEVAEPVEVYSNGYILAMINGLPVRLEVQWDYEAEPGAGDTFTATYSGTNGTVEIRQDATTDFVKQLYLVSPDGNRQLIDIDSAKRLGHEEHFNRVTRRFMGYLDGQPMPEWEKTNTLAKYYMTTGAVEIARSKDN